MSDSRNGHPRGEQLMALRALQLPALKAGTVVVSGGVAKSVLRAIDDYGAKCWASAETIASETCWPVKTVRRALGALERAGFLRIQHRSGQTSHYSIQWQKVTADPGHSDQGNDVGTLDIVTSTLDIQYPDPGHGVPNPGHSDHQNERNESESKKKRRGNQDQDPSRKKPKTRTASETDIQTAEWIFGLLLKMHPEHKKPNIDKWADEIRKLREVDKRTDSQIRQLFQLVNQHDFWKTKILSPSNLRDKWDRLAIELKPTNGTHIESAEVYPPVNKPFKNIEPKSRERV